MNTQDSSSSDTGALLDVAALREIIEHGYVEDSARRKFHIEAIIQQVGVNLQRGVPVRITEEMKTLGIADQVLAMMMKKEAEIRQARLHADDDDDESFVHPRERPNW